MNNFDLRKYLAEGKLYENRVEKTLASLEKEKDNPERVKTLVKALAGLIKNGRFDEIEVLTAVLNKIKEDNIKLAEGRLNENQDDSYYIDEIKRDLEELDDKEANEYLEELAKSILKLKR